MAMSNLSTRIGARALSGTHSSHPLGLLPDVSVVVLVYRLGRVDDPSHLAQALGPRGVPVLFSRD
jgi:hypothetical protein